MKIHNKLHHWFHWNVSISMNQYMYKIIKKIAVASEMTCFLHAFIKINANNRFNFQLPSYKMPDLYDLKLLRTARISVMNTIVRNDFIVGTHVRNSFCDRKLISNVVWYLRWIDHKTRNPHSNRKKKNWTSNLKSLKQN